MPWELQARPVDDSTSLGSIEQVQSKLRASFSDIQLFQDASGSEKLAAMESQGIPVPAVIRDQWLRSKGAYQGLIQAEDFTVEFHLGEDPMTVAAIGIDVRGSGDPTPVVQRLMQVQGWKVVDLQGQPPTPESWKSFSTWRDNATREIDDDERA